MPVETAHTLRQDADRLAGGYPALLAEAERVAALVAAGVHGRRRPGQGETFWQYRPYDVSDPANRIDWRRSARGNAVFVRDTEWEAANSVFIWCDAERVWIGDRANHCRQNAAGPACSLSLWLRC